MRASKGTLLVPKKLRLAGDWKPPILDFLRSIGKWVNGHPLLRPLAETRPSWRDQCCTRAVQKCLNRMPVCFYEGHPLLVCSSRSCRCVLGTSKCAAKRLDQKTVQPSTTCIPRFSAVVEQGIPKGASHFKSRMSGVVLERNPLWRLFEATFSVSPKK